MSNCWNILKNEPSALPSKLNAESTYKSYTFIGRDDGKFIKPLESSLARDLLHESQKISVEVIETLKSMH